MRSIKNTEDMLMGNYKFITCSKTNKHLSSLLSLSSFSFSIYFSLCCQGMRPKPAPC